MSPNDSPDVASSFNVQHEPERSRYSVTMDGAIAVADYHRNGDVIAFTHTEVPPAIQGRGVASALAHRALEDARAAGDHVVPACEFFARYMDTHPEYDDLRVKKPAADSA
jgi:predicted GNAT family acetyltransferase